MGFFEFLTVAVVCGSLFSYLKVRHTGSDPKRFEALERRVAELERERADTHRVMERLGVVEDIVIGDDYGLQKKIEVLESRQASAERVTTEV